MADNTPSFTILRIACTLPTPCASRVVASFSPWSWQSVVYCENTTGNLEANLRRPRRPLVRILCLDNLACSFSLSLSLSLSVYVCVCVFANHVRAEVYKLKLVMEMFSEVQIFFGLCVFACRLCVSRNVPTSSLPWRSSLWCKIFLERARINCLWTSHGLQT